MLVIVGIMDMRVFNVRVFDVGFELLEADVFPSQCA